MVLKRICLLTLCVLVLGPMAGVASASPSIAPAADGPNLLRNPGFESPYAKQCCQTDLSIYLPNMPIDEVQVAEGWLAWWVNAGTYPNRPGSCDGQPQPCIAFHRPEWREANCGAPCANRIRSGGNAQKYFTFFSVHDAGLYQSVSGVSPGARLRFSVYMHAWSAHSNYVLSSGQQSMGMQVGLDPAGGMDPFSHNVVWSAVRDVYDVWGLYTVEAVARNSTVTVFTRSAPVYPLQHNDVYLDDASLVVVSGASSSGGAGPAPSQPPAADDFTVYIVQRGDTLGHIARRFGVNYSALLAANRIVDPNRIFVGQRLIIPGASGGPSTPPAGTTTYVVQPGDNLFRIALRFGTTVNRLMQLNGLTSTLIRVGQVLIVGP
jgi:LysM repeat protein